MKQSKCALIFILYLLILNKAGGQVMSNNSVFINISPNTYFKTGDVENDINSTLNNSGSLSILSLHNSGTMVSNGIMNIGNNIDNYGNLNLSNGTTNIGGVSQQHINSINPIIFNNLILNNNSKFIINTDISVNGQLKFISGQISLGINNFTIGGAVNGMSTTNTFIGSPNSNLIVNSNLPGIDSFFFDQSNDGLTNGLNNFVFQGNAKVILSSKLSVYGKIDVGIGKLDLAGNNVVLKSLISGSTTPTAYISNLITTSPDPSNTINSLQNYSNITIERALTSNNNRAWRLLCPSVLCKSSIRSNWQEGVNTGYIGEINNPNPGYGTEITGIGGAQNGFDLSQTNQSSLYTFDPVSQSYVTVKNTNSSILNPKLGYLLYIRGDRSINLDSRANPLPSGNTILRTSGTILTGDQQYNGLQNGNNFNLISNPYPSSINWNSIYNDVSNSGFTSSYTYWDPNIGTRGAYVTVNKNGVASIGNGTVDIQSGQAFYIQANNMQPVLTIKEQHKSGNNSIDVFKVLDHEDHIQTSLYFYTPDKTRKVAAGAIAIFNNKYSIGIDEYDADGIPNFDEMITYESGNTFHVIESRPENFVSDTLKIYMSNLKVMEYEWQFDASFYTSGCMAELVDSYTAKRSEVNLNGKTSVSFVITNDYNSHLPNRFYIILKKYSVLPVTLIKFNAKNEKNGTLLSWIVSNEIQVKEYEIERSSDGIHFSSLAIVSSSGNSSHRTYNYKDEIPLNGTNYYRLKTIDISGGFAYSYIINIIYKNEQTQINVFPNPVTENKFTIHSDKIDKGNYCISIIDKMGRVIYSCNQEHPGGIFTKNIILNSSVSTGTYILMVGGFHTNVFFK